MAQKSQKDPNEQKPAKIKETNPADTKLISISESFSGPLPHPNILKGYESTCPGSAKRIIKMAEVQSNHRQCLETKIVTEKLKLEKMAIIFGCILLLSITIFGGILVFFNKNTIGYFALFGPVFVPIISYVWKTQREGESQKREEKIKHKSTNKSSKK